MRRPLTLLCLLPLSLLAQPSQQWYQENDRGTHYEGSYTRKVSNPSISLVSLTTPVPAYRFGQRQQLEVQFYTPNASNYQLHAEELRIAQFYWMEDKNKSATAGWNAFMAWPVDYILQRLSIDHRNLAVLIRLGNRGSRQFTPARVTVGKTDNSASLYIAQLRLGRPASGGFFRLYRGQSKSTNSQLLQQKIAPKSSGTVFPIALRFSDLSVGAGWYTVEVNLRERGTGDPFTYSFSFYHRD